MPGKGKVVGRRTLKEIQGPIFIGLDVHKKSYHVAVSNQGGLLATWVAPASPRYLVKQLGPVKQQVVRVVYEAGATGFGLARALRQDGFPVEVIAPSRIPRPVTAQAKTDKLDCRRLAEYASRGMLKPITIPTEEEEAQRAILRLRHQTLDSMRKTKQRIKSFLLYHGIEEPEGLANWTLSSRKELFDLQLLPELRFVLRMLLKELAHQEGFLKRITAQLGHVAKTEKHAATIDYMCTVPGVGSLTAIAFRLEVFRPERFRKPEELACFLGLAPGVRQSGESSRGQGIMPSGQNRLRSMLIEAAWVWRRWDPTAAERYGKLLGKNGVSQKAITAMARRLAIILWRLCLEQRPYQVVR